MSSVAPISGSEESKPVVHMSGVHHGNIVSNRKLMPPIVDPAAIKHESYIPMEFAQSKVQEVSADLNLMKTGYDHYICKMKIFYDTQDIETKSHYENYILDLKKKALRHLEIERAKAKRREETLQASLVSKEEEMEDLRDMSAERISEFQAKILQIKKQHQVDIDDRQECDIALKRILLVIENEAIAKISTNLTEKFSKEIHKKNDEVAEIKNDHTKTLQQLAEDKHNREQQVTKEKEEVERVERSRAQQQVAQSTVTEETKLFMSDLLHQLQFKKQQLLLQKESKKMESLKQSTGERDRNIAQLKEELASERELSSSARMEFQDKYDSLLAEKEALLAEQDVLRREQDAMVAKHASDGRKDVQAKKKADHGEVTATMRSLVSGVESRSRLDSELEGERRRITELTAIIAGLRTEIADAEARAVSQGQIMQQQQQQLALQQANSQSVPQQQQQQQQQPPQQMNDVPHPQTQAQAQAKPIVVVPDAQAEAQKAEDQAELDRLRDNLSALQNDVESDEETLANNMKLKVDTKTAIKQWMKDFEAENGRPPNNEEKASVREMFVAHKTASKQVEAMTVDLTGKRGEITSTEEAIEALEKKIAEAEAAAASSSSSSAMAVGGGGGGGVGSVPDEVVNGYKQRISDLETANNDLNKHLQDVELEKNSVVTLVETLKAEKRTDVIARYESEIEALKQNVQILDASVASSKTEKSKQESKLAELTDRVGKAEEELKERDERDAQKVDQSEEVQQLQGQVAKQRNEIVSKSKAATAGWDAAADTEEKYDMDVKKAYKKGVQEGKEKSKDQLDALTAEIEEKEYRIADLLEAVSDADQKAAQAVRDMEAAISNANAAIEEAVANGGGGKNRGGGRDSDSDDNSDDEKAGEASAELQADLEAAQDEIATLCTQVENLQKSLEISNQKSDIMEKLLAQSQSDFAAASASSAKGSPAANIEVLVEKVKQTTDYGTKLWKDNKKDECCDHYEMVSKEIVETNCQQNLLDTLLPALESAKGQSKRRGAVILRKGLDNFLAEAEKIHSSLASMLSPTKDGPSQESQDALMKQLKSLQEKAAAQKVVESKSVSASGAAAGSSSDAGAGGGNAVLIKRAKAAEDKVKALQKELTAAKKSAPKGKAAAAGGSGKGSAEDAKEIKSLNKHIKDLEKQLNSGGGGGGAAKEKIALANQEKKFKKELKEMETTNRKEKSALEKELVGVKSELEKVTDACGSATEERNALRTRVEELGNANAEMEALRAKADQLDEMQAHVKTMKKEIVDLTAQYKKEANLRKKYKNELEDLKGAIRVYARVRPFAKYEIEKECQGCVNFPDETSVTVHTARGDKEFEFDAAFRDDSTQDEVFEDTKRLVESMIDGFNVCLFAYGQTGSGKTFTMTGTPDMPGLTPRAIGEMFFLIGEKKNCTVRVSTYFVELYNDAVVDLYWLLDNKHTKGRPEPPKLDIKVDAKKMVFVKNAVIKSVDSSDELLNLFHKGNLERHVGATKMNAESSRSHSIFAVMCESYDATTKKTTVGKLSLVDLAGSERADKTGAGAERLREAQSINKSLSALGDVISALSEGEKFIPYRNNKLTQLMQDSLGGNAKTLMFVNFSPADYNCDETVTSLSYATRVKKITNNASKQAESEEVARLKAMIKKLQGGHALVEDEGEGGGEEESKGS